MKFADYDEEYRTPWLTASQMRALADLLEDLDAARLAGIGLDAVDGSIWVHAGDQVTPLIIDQTYGPDARHVASVSDLL